MKTCYTSLATPPSRRVRNGPDERQTPKGMSHERLAGLTVTTCLVSYVSVSFQFSTLTGSFFTLFFLCLFRPCVSLLTHAFCGSDLGICDALFHRVCVVLLSPVSINQQVWLHQRGLHVSEDPLSGQLRRSISFRK